MDSGSFSHLRHQKLPVRFPQLSSHLGNKFKPSLAAVGSQAEQRAAFRLYPIKAD